MLPAFVGGAACFAGCGGSAPLHACQFLQERLQVGGNITAVVEHAAKHGCHSQIFGIAFIKNASVAPEGKHVRPAVCVG